MSTQIEWKESRSKFLEYANPAGYRLLCESARENLDLEAAALYLALLKEGRTPAWAACDIDVKTMKMALK